jgi:prepilin-type N-terminal cleavage/methylation domain-containing protein
MRNNKQKGFSLIELLIVVAIILIIAAIAIPNLLRSKMAANEASAVAALRTLNTTEILYSTNCNSLSTDLTSLGPAVVAGTPVCKTGEDLVDVVMSGEVTTAPTNGSPTKFSKSGYTFVYSPGAAAEPNAAYKITAVPVSIGGSGLRGFYTDQTGVIHANTTGAAGTAGDPPL